MEHAPNICAIDEYVALEGFESGPSAAAESETAQAFSSWKTNPDLRWGKLPS
jgi:hypothetical protein